MNKTIRLVDVAKAAGVSRGTASNVFNHPELVRPEVRERVAETARSLGYGGPDPKGRLLRAGKVNAIGLVLSGTLAAGFRDPFDQLFMSGIGEVCDAHGAGLALLSAYGEYRESTAWNIRSAVVDGFIVHCLEAHAQLLDIARQRNLPFVAVDVEPEPGDMGIRIDDRAAARTQARHLLDLGHRSIGIVSLELVGEGHFGFVDRARHRGARYVVTRDRLNGYADAFRGVGIDLFDLPIFEAPIVQMVVSPNKAAQATAAILERAPETTAILAMSDVAALGALAYARDNDIAVPEELSIIGFDGTPAGAASVPRLTTMAQPIVEKGRRAAEMVLAGGPPGVVTLGVKLVAGGTTAPPRT